LSTPSPHFIRDYKKFILDSIPTNPDWAELLARTTLATAIGPNIRVRSSIGPLALNIFGLNVAHSGDQKSTPLNYFLYPTFKLLSEKVNTDLILPRHYSQEGMIEWLMTKSSQGIIIHDEFTQLLKSAKAKDWAVDSLEFLSELYDCTAQKRFTKKSKLESADKVYVNLVTATTHHLFEQGTFSNLVVQGLIPRFHVVHGPPTYKRLSKEEYLERPWKELDERHEIIEKFVGRLEDLRYGIPRYLGFDGPAAKLLTDYLNRRTREAKDLSVKDPFNLKSPYLKRLPEFALKDATLYQISSWEKHIADSGAPEISIDLRNAKKGIERADNSYKNYCALLGSWSGYESQPKPIRIKSNKLRIDKVLEILEKSGGKIAHTKLLEKVEYMSDMTSLMRMLEETGEIVANGRGVKGDPYTYELVKKRQKID